MQAAAVFIRAKKNCLAGSWPQLAALLSAFCDANDAAPGCNNTGQSSDIACLVELVEALPYTEHAALLVLKVRETVLSDTRCAALGLVDCCKQCLTSCLQGCADKALRKPVAGLACW